MSNIPSPRRLRVAGRVGPLGVDPDAPRFGWLVPETVATQTAYELRIAADPDAVHDGDPLHEEVVESDATTGVSPDAPSLAPRTRYHWTVRVRDERGRWSAWSDPAAFETGLERWTGRWIGAAGEAYETTPAPAPVFRTTFAVDAPVERARLHVAGGGTCDPRLNGDRITDRALDPAQSDYEERVLYATHDVTDAVRRGTNALAVVCGRERYAMTTEDAWGWHDAPWTRDHPELLAELTITLADGTERTVATDGSWRVGPSATRFDCLYTGEVYDAREAAAPSDPAFDDGAWTTAAEVAGPEGRLVPQRVQPVEPVRTVAPEAIEEPLPGTYVVDFGEMIAGWVRLAVDAPEGTEIALTHGERRHDDGTVNVDQVHLDARIQTDRYVCSGAGVETWEPRFSYKGFRYVQLEGLPDEPTAETVTAVVAHTTVEADADSEFECSNDLLNAIHRNSRRALLSNHHGIPTDTPTYEKNGWTGDAQLTAETALYNFEMRSFYRKWLDDVADAQRDTGEVPPIVPTSDWGYADGSHDASIRSPNPAWDAAYVLVPWWVYRHCGDRALLADHYDGMAALVRYLGTHADGGVLDVGLGDWLAPGRGEIRSVPPEGPAITSTAYYYRLAEVVRDAAAVLGRERDREAFADRAARIRGAFNDAFLDPAAGVYATGEAEEYRQTSNVLPLAYDLVPEESREAVVAALVENLGARDDHLDTGILGTKHLLGVLCDHGHVDLAYRVATRRTYPSWGHWIEHGASSLYEAWELDSRSRNHHMFGSVDGWLYEYLAGIRPAEPGFATVAIEPHLPTGLDAVDATVDTVRGAVRAGWERTADGPRIDVELPPNAGGVARVPGRDPRVDGEAIADDAAVRIRDGDGRTAVDLPPGSWTIRVD